MQLRFLKLAAGFLRHLHVPEITFGIPGLDIKKSYPNLIMQF